LAGGEICGDHYPKTVVVVPVIGIVPVAAGTAGIPVIIVVRAAAQHPVVCGQRPRRQRQVSIRTVALLNRLLRKRDFDPTAQQAPDFGHHFGSVLILAWFEPIPTGGQTQIGAHPVEGFISQMQVAQAFGVFAVIGDFELLAQIEGRIQQTAGESVPLGGGKVIGHWQKPGEKIERTGENGRFLTSHIVTLNIF